MKSTAEDLRILIPESIRRGQAELWTRRQTRAYTYTAEDLLVAYGDGTITDCTPGEFEIVEGYDDLDCSRMRKALGIRAGQRTEPVR